MILRFFVLFEIFSKIIAKFKCNIDKKSDIKLYVVMGQRHFNCLFQMTLSACILVGFLKKGK